MKTRRKQLSTDDRRVWAQVARSVDPLPGRTVPEMPDETVTAGEPAVAQTLPKVIAEAKDHAGRLVAPAGPHGIDRTTRKKLAKGRLPIDSKVDLHGMTQTTAHAVLLGFLHDAYRQGRRHVLVVTGKGASFGSDGVLRRQVPAWLTTPAFRGIVSGHHDAARGHGGEGALYVRLRRRPERPS